jgi:7-cyano-7-deazaguanine synthase
MAAPPKSLAVVLCSGGLRSFICATLAARESRIGIIHINDGRGPAPQLLNALDKQTTTLRPAKTWVLDAGYIKQMALAAETMGMITSESSDAMSALNPLRDLQFLSIAAGLARSFKAPTIFWGIHRAPKESESIARIVEATQQFNALLGMLTPDFKMTIKTPLLGLEDRQLIELGQQMGVPFEQTWSCQMTLDRPCMSCPACAWRIRAFRAAQIADPLIVAKR